MAEEVSKWLKSVPLAPEYHPTVIEFQDPISYIFKIEEEASKYGICKIIPPVSASPKSSIIANLNQTLSSQNPDSSPTFTTREQQIGFCPRKQPHPVQRSVWQSGKRYTLPQFEAKAKNFEKNYLNKESNSKKGLSALEIETLFWKAQIDQPFSVEYGNDMPGSAFDRTGGGIKQGKVEVDDVFMTVGETEWNMRWVSRAKGSLLKFLRKEIPGVTSPMVYIGMLFSWFAWHVEDHELHSLNYMHMGAPKTWYGVPMDAAAAFEDVIRTEGYAADISPIRTYATLTGKTIVMTPEILVEAGVPCCRLVQNAGEFVVTFPRAYHSGFSHGFNCAEATNIATPGWLRVAREAAIRRASIGFAPMMCHSQLLYDLVLSLSISEETSRHKPRSSRLKDRMKDEGDVFVKRIFMEDVMKNNELFRYLGNGFPVTLLSENDLKSFTDCLNIQNHESSSSGGIVLHQRPRRTYSTYGEPKTKADPARIFSCLSCGNPCYAGAGVVLPTDVAAKYLKGPEFFSGKLQQSTSHTAKQKDTSALGFLTLAYSDSSESEEDELGSEVPQDHKHIFCLPHAHEIEQCLRSVGGVHLLLVCHPEYKKIDAAAKEVAKELGTSGYNWTDLGFVNLSEQGKAIIQMVLNKEIVKNVNKDWAVRLGVNIFHSAQLSASPLYRKQMPYNSVIYKAFGNTDPSNDPMTHKKSGKQKKVIVAGRWCGKVWISHHVHPFLLSQDCEQD